MSKEGRDNPLKVPEGVVSGTLWFAGTGFHKKRDNANRNIRTGHPGRIRKSPWCRTNLESLQFVSESKNDTEGEGFWTGQWVLRLTNVYSVYIQIHAEVSSK